MRSGFDEPEIKLVKDGLVKNRRAATKTDQPQERRLVMVMPFLILWNCSAPKFCEIKVVILEAIAVIGKTAKDMMRRAATWALIMVVPS